MEIQGGGHLATLPRSRRHTQAMLVKYDFDEAYTGRLTGWRGCWRCGLTESMTYSGVRWFARQLPRDSTGNGGVTIMQDGGLQGRRREVKGTVTCASRVVGESWARQHRALSTGDNDGNSFRHPDGMECDFEFVPWIDGVAVGTEQNVKLFRVGFTFGETLPNYLLTN